MGIETPGQALRDPLRGGLYENLVIVEIREGYFNSGKRPDLFFYRDTHGNEADLIITTFPRMPPWYFSKKVYTMRSRIAARKIRCIGR